MEAAGIASGGSEAKTGLEDDFGRQLKRTRSAELAGNLLYIDDRSGIAGADCGACLGCRVERWIAITVRRVWVGCTGMVEHVGCFCAELKPRSLPYLEILENGEVGVRETRSVKSVSRRVAEGIIPRSNCGCSGNKRVLSNGNCINSKVDT